MRREAEAAQGARLRVCLNAPRPRHRRRPAHRRGHRRRLAAAGYAVLSTATLRAPKPMRSRLELAAGGAADGGRGGRSRRSRHPLGARRAGGGALGPLTLLVNNASLFESDTSQEFEFAALEPAVRGQPPRPALLAQAFAAQGPARRRSIDRQHRRPARAQPDAAEFLVHAEQGGAACRDDDDGASAGSPDPRERRGAGTHRAERAGRRGGARQGSGRRAARARRRRRARSPRPCSTSPAPAASPAR